jgi:hypothetical protein
MSVNVANGALIPCNAQVQNFQWWIQGHTFEVDAKIIEMEAYDLVLGMDWLERFRPMVCDWLEKWIEFQHNNTIVRLRGILPSTSAVLQEVSIEQVMKWDRGNDLWVAVLLEPCTKFSTLTDHYLLNGVPTKIKGMIYDFDALFKEPSALPPSRTYDHFITLLPNAALVN